MPKKYIKKINMPVGNPAAAEDLYVKDEEAVSSINGYSNSTINNGTQTFANTAISESEINTVLGISNND